MDFNFQKLYKSMKTFEQWLVERHVIAPAAPVGAPPQPAAPTQTPAQNQQTQQTQQTAPEKEKAPEKAPIEPGQENNFVTKAKMQMLGWGLGGGNEAINQIRETIGFYHNDQNRQTAFANKMTTGFKDLEGGEQHPFNKYLKIMIDKAKLQQYDSGDEPIDLNQPFDAGYGSGFTPIGYEGDEVIDRWGSAISQAVADFGNITQIGQQSQRSVFNQ